MCQDGPVTKSAYLRVYAPDIQGSDDPVPGFVSKFALVSEDAGGGELVAQWGGAKVTCPSHLRLRVLESTVAFANAYQGLDSGLVPEDVASAADRALRDYHLEHPSHRSHVLTSPWHVPVRWFVAFDPAEREVYEGPNGPRLRYRTALEDARSRVGRGHQILHKLEMFPGPAEELAQLVEWLGPFDNGSMVELDYAGVSELFEPSELVFDDSCEVVSESLQALADGDMLRAGEMYGKVVTRWAPAFSVTFSN